MTTKTADEAPAKRWEPPAWSAAYDTDSPGNQSAAVLVVDDDENIRRSSAAILRTAGYTTLEAADGEDAYDFLTNMRFQALVLDLKMPRCDGVTLLARLKEPPPVVILSGDPLAEDEADNLTCLITQLRKPVSPYSLLDAVNVAVNAPVNARGHARQRPGGDTQANRTQVSNDPEIGEYVSQAQIVREHAQKVRNRSDTLLEEGQKLRASIVSWLNKQ